MKQEPIRVTRPTLEILAALLAAKSKVWGLELVRQTGLKTGTVYPILARLETFGWIQSSWEVNQKHKGPRRRLWQLTEDGEVRASELISSKKQAEPSLRGLRLNRIAQRIAK
jgi:DNA-binding PadR family transcriptional regulator